MFDSDMFGVSDLIAWFKKVNVDCAATGESVVPLTDYKYYTHQIANMLEIGDEEAEKLAVSMAKKVAKGGYSSIYSLPTAVYAWYEWSKPGDLGIFEHDRVALHSTDCRDHWVS